MSGADRSLYRVQTSQKLSNSGMSVDITNVINPDGTTSPTPASCTDASIVFSNTKGTKLEMAIGTMTGGVLTLSYRGLDTGDTISEVTANKLNWPAGTIVYVTKLAFDMVDLQGNNAFTGNNTHSGTELFTNKTTISGANGQLDMTNAKKGFNPPSLTTAERLALPLTGTAIVYDSTLGEYYQLIAGTWQVFAAGSTQPNMTDTVAGKGQSSTQTDFDAGTDNGVTGAQNVAKNSQLQKMINTSTAKTTLDNADQIAIADSADSNKNKKITYANIKKQLAIDTNNYGIKFGGDGSDGVVDGLGDITLTGSDNTLIIKNYESWVAGDVARVFDIGILSGCNFIIKIKGDADFTNWTINGKGGYCKNPGPFPKTTPDGGGQSFFQYEKATGGGYGGGSSNPGSGGGGYSQNGYASGSGTAGGTKPNASMDLTYILAARLYRGGAGAGGGGTGPYNTYYATGGGGGSCIIFEVGGNVKFDGTTVIDVSGGNGIAYNPGNATNSGGGGGGVFVLLYNGTKTGSCTPNVAGGLKGNGGGMQGGNGGDGAYLIAKNTVFA